MGCVRVSIQRGQTIAGSRSTRWRRMRNEALPAPMTIAARAWTVPGTAAARMLGDLLAAAQVLGVAALQAAEVDDAPHAGGARGPREGRRAGAVALRRSRRRRRPSSARGSRRRRCPRAPGQRALVQDVALDDLGPPGQRGAARVARQAAHVQAVLQQRGRQMAADVAGGAGDEDLGHPLRYGRGRRGMSPAGGVVRTGHDGRVDGRWAEHQGGRRADRAGARHDPHVGAALRLPQPAAHGLGLPALRARRRRDAAPRAGPPRARALGERRARARPRDPGDLRPPVDLRRGGGDRPRRARRRSCASRR